jgi:uncharacterized Zn-binding protein involved in type VI secretion
MFTLIGSICVGDKTSCGGTILTGSPVTDVNGRSVARIGDRIACKYYCVIITGNHSEIIDGAPMALHGSQTSRGCTCLSGNNDFHGDSQTAEAAAAVPAAADAGIAYMPETADALNEDHWIEFQLTDGENKPRADVRYVVTDPTGTTISGFLNENGYAKVSPVKAGICQIDFPEIGYSATVESCQ